MIMLAETPENDKFVTAMGIELSYIAPNQVVYDWQKKNGQTVISVSVTAMNYVVMNYVKEAKLKYHDLHKDGGLTDFEISTPIFRSFSQMKEWYDKWDVILKKLPHEATYDKWYKPGGVWKGSGGGHIHVTVPGNRKHKAQIIKNVYRFMAVRPWMNWVFNEWCDTSNANSLLSLNRYSYHATVDFIDRLNTLNNSGSEYFSKNDDMLVPYIIHDRPLSTKGDVTIVLHVDLDKDYAIRWDGNSLEFRIFDAPKNYKQLEEHIILVNAIMKYCMRRDYYKYDSDSNELPKLSSWIEHNGYNYKGNNERFVSTISESLGNLCNVLNLNYDMYKKYIKNLERRLYEDEKLT